MMIFGHGHFEGDIYAGWNRLEVVTCMNYLGHSITNNNNDSTCLHHSSRLVNIMLYN